MGGDAGLHKALGGARDGAFAWHCGCWWWGMSRYMWLLVALLSFGVGVGVREKLGEGRKVGSGVGNFVVLAGVW